MRNCLKTLAALFILSAQPLAAEPRPAPREQPTPGQHAFFAGQANAPAPAQPSDYRLETIASGLNRPWSMAFLPDDRILISERAGALRLVDADGQISAPLDGLPPVKNAALGGFLDVVLDPEFSANRTVYFTYLEPRDDVFGISVARGRLDWSGAGLSEIKVIFRAEPAQGTDTNLGGRMLFGKDGMLYVAIGDRFQLSEVQSLSSHLGTIIRIMRDGGVPPDNPFVGRPGVRPEIYAYGVRNPLGLAMDAAGNIWEVENGAKGGDELNLLRPGANYGWPLITYGRGYDDKPIGSGTAQAGLEQPVYYWDPSIAVSGMTFYNGNLFPDWTGDIFISSLKGQRLSRLSLREGKVFEEEEMLGELKTRIRDVREGPDGALYILTDEDSARLVRMTPNLVSDAARPVRR